jgi:formylmethanofuran dehydrogenase subunit E
MSDWRSYLEKADAYHGHICSGQILGIRMALLGLELLDLRPGDNLRDLVLFLETDRCVADALYVVTGVTLGRRRVKVLGYGKTAASFLDLKTGKAFRIWVKNSERPPHEADQVGFWHSRDDKDIFAWREVVIRLPDSELPGPPVSVVPCAACAEDVLDRKEVVKNGQTLCLACAEGAYYHIVEEARA